MKPLIVQSPLSGSWFVLTRYREKHGIDAETGEETAYLAASVKYDVTDQMTKILTAQKRKRKK